MSTGGMPQRSPERAPDELLDRDDDEDEALEVDEEERRRASEERARERDGKLSQKVGTVDGEDDSQDETERKARRLGWKPESEWRGAKGKWVDAETFLERATANSSINRENMDKLHAQVESLSKTLEEERAENRRREEESGKVLNEIVDRFSRADAAAYARAERDIAARQRKAVEDGDTEAYDKAEEDRKKLKPPPAMAKVGQRADGDEGENEDEGDKTTKRTPDQERWVNAVVAWKGRPENAWFSTDPFLNHVAQAIHVQLRKDNPDWTPEQNLAALDEEVRDRFPEKFENKARRSADAPRPKERRGGGPGGEHRRGRTYADLPPDAKDACDRFVRQIRGYTVEDYLKTYEWED